MLAITVDDEVLMAPVIRDEIPGGEVRIDLGADTNLADAQTLALKLRAGALPAPLEHVGTFVVTQ